MRVRYRNVGLEFDLSGSLPWYETLRLVYDDVALEIEDPGAWTVEGPLGAVLRVVGTRAGAGSTWIEVDLEFLVDLGVVTISRAIVRLTIDDDGGLRVEVRGITVDVDIPGTLTGSGTLSLGDGGVFKAGIDVTVVPVQLTVGAALALTGQLLLPRGAGDLAGRHPARAERARPLRLRRPLRHQRNAGDRLRRT